MIEKNLIDTHSHLDDEKFSGEVAEVIARAKEAGVSRIITIACWDKEKGFTPTMALVEEFPELFFALGIHPHDAKDVEGSDVYDDIRELAANHKDRLVAIGEAGLDYHYDNSPREIQQEVFIKQINLAKELKLPLIVHTREAEAETLEILKKEGIPEAGGVIHCFSGSVEMARTALDMGLYLSFTGVITFPKATELRDVLKDVPIERIMVETDAPYLAPVPYRGKRSEPAQVVATAEKIAEVKGLSLEDVARITTQNAESFFKVKDSAAEDSSSSGSASSAAKIAYKIRNSLYLNITNRCTNRCTFCAKFSSYTVKGHYLKLAKEPEFADVLKAVEELGTPPIEYDEIVFCGYGESLIRVELVKKIGMYFKKMGCRIRIDTDGLANLVHGRNVLPELAFADCISVSLNAVDSDTYERLCKTPFGDKAYPAILWFLREAKKHIARVQATVVSVPGLDVEACRKIAEEDIGVAFRVREYNNVG
jgi:TatD DNase family protein